MLHVCFSTSVMKVNYMSIELNQSRAMLCRLPISSTSILSGGFFLPPLEPLYAKIIDDQQILKCAATDGSIWSLWRRWRRRIHWGPLCKSSSDPGRDWHNPGACARQASTCGGQISDVGWPLLRRQRSWNSLDRHGLTGGIRTVRFAFNPFQQEYPSEQGSESTAHVICWEVSDIEQVDQEAGMHT